MKRRPPRLALALLNCAIPEGAREEIEGDLIEEFERDRRTRLWFWRQAASISWSYRPRWSMPRANIPALFHDARSGARALRRRPAFALAAGALLALGIGVNAAMYQWIDALWNRSLPYADADRLVRVFHSREGSRESLSPPNYFDLAEEREVFESVAAYWSPSLTLTGDAEPEKLLAATVSHSFFEVLGVAPLAGRTFSPDDDRPGAPPVAVLGRGLFHRRFAGDRGVIGREILLDGAPATVIGVVPEGFSYPAPGTELWVPLRLPRDRPDQGGSPYRSFRILNVVGRLRENTSLLQARARLASLSDRLAREYPGSNLNFHLEVEDLREVERGPLRAPLFLLGGSLFLLLLLVCANVSGLWIARLLARERELAVRVAMGASRARLLRELLAEGLFVSLLGAAGGSFLGIWIAAGARAAAPAGLPAPDVLETGSLYPVVFLAILLPIFLALASAPAIFGRGKNLANSLRPGGRVEGGSARAGARRVLVVLEMALASILLIGAMLLLKSFRALENVDRGFRGENVYFTSVELPFTRYRESHRRARFFEDLQARLRQTPGVERASISLGLPLDPRAEFFVTRSPYSVEGRGEAEAGRKPEAALHVVGPELFETLGVSITRGRGFDARDHRAAAPVVIVNESFARAEWPGEDPLGKEIHHDLVLLPDDASRRRVVGVVSDFRYYALEREPEPQMYVPHGQSPWPSMHLLLRASAEPDSLHAEVRQILRELDADVPLAPLTPVADVGEGVVAAPRLRARLLTGFAAAAALLAVIGLYGVISFSVASRTREIGLRVALGARRNEIVSLVVGQALELALVGGGLGLVGAALSTRWISSLLYGVGPFDPWSYGSTAGTLVLVAALASYLPARRALAVDPTTALRSE
jgi:putative ABC transport system permease protein